MGDTKYWGDLETPAALVDVDRMKANLDSAGDYCRESGINYRPHAKTHKSALLAREQLNVGAVGLTVATPKEAEVIAQVADDILVAYPPVGPHRLSRLMALPETVKLSVGLDSSDSLQSLGREACKRGRTVGVLIEVDVGLGRVGLTTIEGTLRLAAEAADTRGISYRGLLFYPGHIRVPFENQGPMMKALSRELGPFLSALREAGLPPEIVSGGSTPTFYRSHQVDGVTEVRAGTGIFNDRTTAILGACAWTDCAYSVLTTVVSTTVPGQAVVDAGSKALAKEDIRAVLAEPGTAAGFGCVLDEPGLRVTALSEEHGVIDIRNSPWRPTTGDLIRIVPNHACVSVNLHEHIWQVQGDRVLGRWTVEARGR
jgi:D-serine deaminase-like pyridoxal phosphate-dependent protein